MAEKAQAAEKDLESKNAEEKAEKDLENENATIQEPGDGEDAGGLDRA